MPHKNMKGIQPTKRMEITNVGANESFDDASRAKVTGKNICGQTETKSLMAIREMS